MHKSSFSIFCTTKHIGLVGRWAQIRSGNTPHSQFWITNITSNLWMLCYGFLLGGRLGFILRLYMMSQKENALFWKVGVSVILSIYRVSQEECARLQEGVPYVKIYRYNPKHLCPKLSGYGDNGQRKVRSCVCSANYT
jgi:hypothetical protein